MSHPSAERDPTTGAAEHDATVAGRSVPLPPAVPFPLEVVGLAALVLIVSRYDDDTVRVSVAKVDASPPTWAFLPFRADPTSNVTTFLTHVSEAVERAPDPLLGGESSGASRLERLRWARVGYAWGGRAHAPPPKDRAALLVSMLLRERRVELVVELRATPFASWYAEQLAAHLERAIHWLVTHPDAPLHELDLCTARERAHVARTFNAADVPRPAGLTLHGLVAEQALRTPGAPAIVCDTVCLDYRTLDEQAGRVAAALRTGFHVRPGDRVGVMLQRSERSVLALLGVMRAGAAYVPIDPRHPWDVVRHVLEDAGIDVLVVDAETIAKAAPFAGALLVIDLELRAEGSSSADAVPVREDDLAYVIYTSGSTGRPKGVAIEHRAIVNTLLWRNQFYGIGPGDVNLQLPSFAFDSSVVDIFCVLSAGGTLVIPREGLRLAPHRVRALCDTHGVTSFIATPSYYRQLIGALAGAGSTLRTVTLAGESITPDLVALHRDTLPDVTLVNEYGPTENAVCSAACIVDPELPTISIGRPISNVQIYVVDGRGRLCPPGVPGELLLAGAGLARGYLHRPNLTRERFVTSPLPDLHSGRMYRTGDRGLWNPDGTLAFLGRLDNQVKVRGFRVELDEVEHALSAHAGIRQGAVLCRPDARGADRLLAYVCAEDGLTPAGVRAHLSTVLPFFMVPDVIRLVRELPLNVNGKVDRHALALLDDAPDRVGDPSAPTSPLEGALLGLSARVLDRADMTVDDDFFESGGNSLGAMEFTASIRSEFALPVELLDIYTFPTIRGLARRLDGLVPEK